MEEIYVNVERGKPCVDPRPSINQTGPRSSKGGFHGAIVLFLGLLSVFLLAGLIILGVFYHNAPKLERDLLNANLTEMTKELNRLQSLSKQKKTCPAGWRMFSCTCYLFSTESGSWEKGRQDCRNSGADLVVIDSYEEQEFLTKIIKTNTWIGLSDRDNEGTWKWTDDTPLTQTYWWEGQPDNGGRHPQSREEDCALIEINRKTDKNWNDRPCGDTRQWICEKMA